MEPDRAPSNPSTSKLLGAITRNPGLATIALDIVCSLLSIVHPIVKREEAAPLVRTFE